MNSEILVTGKCLIAADVDKTYVEQGMSNEKESFILNLAPQLNKAALLGTNLAVITGNSMHELSTRFLPWYVKQLCLTNCLHTIDKLHLFCNSGGIYIHFSKNIDIINTLLLDEKPNEKDVLDKLTYKDNKTSKILIKPEFIKNEYIYKTRIKEDEKNVIIEILNKEWENYKSTIEKNYTELSSIYYMNQSPPEESKSTSYNFVENNKLKEGLNGVDSRMIKYLESGIENEFAAQITLKPILSWRFAKDFEAMFNNDLRTDLVNSIQEELDRKGLSHYCARPGGRSSIDITLEKVDKAYALEYLIDSLNIGGQKRLGEKIGCNTIYLGDEVISGGGNDYSITRIPGVLVLAVNPEPEFIPFLSNVLVPSAILSGPAASANILAQYNEIAETEIKRCNENIGNSKINNAITILKEKWFIECIKEKVNSSAFKKNLTIEEKNMIHTLVTLVTREDNTAKEWLKIIVNEFDEILKTLENHKLVKIAGRGTSHEDN